MERSLTRTHKYLLALFIGLMIAGGAFRLYHAGVFGNPAPRKDVEFTVLPDEELHIHVKGEVKRPGVYTLEQGARWIDAVEAAGGFTVQADRSGKNLAQYLRDGQEVNIPRVKVEKLPPGGPDAEVEPPVSKVKPGDRVNINTAGEEELMRLPGIGPTLASRIIETRNRRGAFKKTQEIMLVPGIGRSKFLRMEMYIAVEKP